MGFKDILQFIWDIKILWIILMLSVVIGYTLWTQTIEYNHQLNREQDGRIIACNQLYGEDNWEINYSAYPAPCQNKSIAK